MLPPDGYTWDHVDWPDSTVYDNDAMSLWKSVEDIISGKKYSALEWAEWEREYIIDRSATHDRTRRQLYCELFPNLAQRNMFDERNGNGGVSGYVLHP